MTIRDAIWDVIYEEAKKNKNIMVISIDYAAPALDKFRQDLPSQYINVGIAEQSGILTAVGLAMSGKKVYVTALNTFLAYRDFEQIRLHVSAMHLPITFVAGGTGIGFDDGGTTHHAVEDLSLFRTLPFMQIYTPADNISAKKIAELSLISRDPFFIRCDRMYLPDIYSDDATFESGMNVLAPLTKTSIVSTGNLTHTALDVSKFLKEEKNLEIGIIDLYKLPVNVEYFIELTKNVNTIITLEEHTLPGGLGSNICEVICDYRLNKKIKRFGFDFSNGYTHDYGGREYLHSLYGFGSEEIKEYILHQAE